MKIPSPSLSPTLSLPWEIFAPLAAPHFPHGPEKGKEAKKLNSSAFPYLHLWVGDKPEGVSEECTFSLRFLCSLAQGNPFHCFWDVQRCKQVVFICMRELLSDIPPLSQDGRGKKRMSRDIKVTAMNATVEYCTFS